MNDTLFIAKAKDEGRTFRYISRKLGITEFGLKKKRNGTIPWKIDEINEVTKLLNLTDKERDDIFGLISTQ